MTEAKIKTPIKYNLNNHVFEDADGNDLSMNGIANALSRQSELEAEVKVLREGLKVVLDVHAAAGDECPNEVANVVNTCECCGILSQIHGVATEALAAADTRGDDDGK